MREQSSVIQEGFATIIYFTSNTAPTSRQHIHWLPFSTSVHEKLWSENQTMKGGMSSRLGNDAVTIKIQCSQKFEEFFIEPHCQGAVLGRNRQQAVVSTTQSSCLCKSAVANALP